MFEPKSIFTPALGAALAALDLQRRSNAIEQGTIDEVVETAKKMAAG